MWPDRVAGYARWPARNAEVMKDHAARRSETIGLAWLMEDRGEEAIPHPDQAVEGAPDGRAESLQESLHDLACGDSLAGRGEAACRAARELLSGRIA